MTLCLIGMALGIGAAVVIGDLAGWPVFIGLDAVAFAFGLSGAVGVFFRWYRQERHLGWSRWRR